MYQIKDSKLQHIEGKEVLTGFQVLGYDLNREREDRKQQKVLNSLLAKQKRKIRTPTRDILASDLLEVDILTCIDIMLKNNDVLKRHYFNNNIDIHLLKITYNNIFNYVSKEIKASHKKVINSYIKKANKIQQALLDKLKMFKKSTNI